MVMHRNSLSTSILSLGSFFRQVKFYEKVVMTRGCVGLSHFVQDCHTVFMDNMQIFFATIVSPVFSSQFCLTFSLLVLCSFVSGCKGYVLVGLWLPDNSDGKSNNSRRQ